MKKYNEIYHLITSNHITFYNDKLSLTDTYKDSINNTSNFYYTNETVKKIIEENKNLTFKQYIKKLVRENRTLNSYQLNCKINDVKFYCLGKTSNNNNLRLLELKRQYIQANPKRNTLINNLLFKLVELEKQDQLYCDHYCKLYNIETEKEKKVFFRNRKQIEIIDNILKRTTNL